MFDVIEVQRRERTNVSPTSRKKPLSVIISLTVVTAMFIVPFSVPLFSNVIVLMSTDSTISIALEALQANVDDTIVVKKDSLEYWLTISRAVGPVVWISHGQENGIVADKAIVPWSDFVSILDTYPGRDIVLACDSERIYEYEDSQDIIALGGRIDVLLGSLVASWLLTGSQSVLEMAVDRAQEVMSDPSQVKALYWSTDEMFWAGIDAGIWMVSTLCTTFAIWRVTLNPFAAIDIFAGLFVLIAEIVKFVTALVGFISGTMAAWTLFTKFGGLIASVLWAIFIRAPWYVVVIASVEVSVSIATGVRVVAALLAIIGMVTLVAAILGDQADSDSVYGRMSFGF